MSDMPENLPEPQSLSYEEARDELMSIVRALEGGQTPLEDTIAMWERGEALAARCASILDTAQQRLEQASTSTVE